jgi:hypothetical protein
MCNFLLYSVLINQIIIDFHFSPCSECCILCRFHLYRWCGEDGTERVFRNFGTKFRCREITQKKEYNKSDIVSEELNTASHPERLQSLFNWFNSFKSHLVINNRVPHRVKTSLLVSRLSLSDEWLGSLVLLFWFKY